jgi:exoribonuclease R
MDEDANVLEVRFTKSVIASKAAFTYEEAQLRKDDPCAPSRRAAPRPRSRARTGRSRTR